MGRITFDGEFEINASRKMLFPYLSTAAGLSQWFADDVNLTPKRDFIFEWDGEKSIAKVAQLKRDQSIRFEFESEDEQPNFLEFSIEVNELTQSVYIKVSDSSSDIDDPEEFQELWDNLIFDLKELVGG